MRKITLTGGPLDGKTFDVPEHADRIDHHAAEGYYSLDGTWHADDLDADLGDALAQLAKPLTDAEVGDFIGGLAEFLGTGIPRLVREARMGRRVLIVAKTRKRAVELWDEALPLATDAHKVRRAKGAERITFQTGGILVPVGLNSTSYRGIAADTVYLADGLTDADAADVLPALSTSAEPAILHGDAA